LIEISREYTEP